MHNLSALHDRQERFFVTMTRSVRPSGARPGEKGKVDVDMLNAVKCVLADVSSAGPSSEQRDLRQSREFFTLTKG